MNKYPVYKNGCYYCICTACNSPSCPHRNKLYKMCTYCQEHGENRPKLFCSFFSHFAKKYHYKVKKVRGEKYNKLVVKVSDDFVVVCNSAEEAERIRRRYPLSVVQLMRIDLPEDDKRR